MEFLATEQEKEEYLAYKCQADVINNYKIGLEQLEQFDFSEYCDSVLICGGMAAFDKGLLNFINKYSIALLKNNERLFLLSEVTAEFRRYTSMNVICPFICTPHLFAKEIIINNMEIDVSDEIRETVNKCKYLMDAVENLNRRHMQLGNGYAEVWVYFADKYIRKLLDKLMPKRVILWNPYYAFHYIFEAVCKEKGIKIQYMEFGCIPGTIMIDDGGQQGESLIAKKSINSKLLYVNRQDILHAKHILSYLRKSGLNRNIQPNINFNCNLLTRYQSGRKNVLYFGQNDYESGIFPYTKRAKKNFSPIFSSTLSALEYLSILAINKSWNFIYKPHPIMQALGLEYDKSQQLSCENIISDVNINDLIDHMDVTVTILSQSAYISLIRNKPVVILGYTELRNKKCTYEAFKKKYIPFQIERAIKYGFTIRQKKNFERHVAQLIKYYLYDDTLEKTIKIGKEI